jgi:DNA topoisomerase IB/uncharacterized membrane protein (UPF0127 family)
MELKTYKKVITQQPVNDLRGNNETVSGGFGPDVESNPLTSPRGIIGDSTSPAGLGVYCRKSEDTKPFNIKIGDQIFHVTKTEDPEIGLSNTEDLETKSGMFFELHNELDKVPIDMGRMKYPLDIIFITIDMKVSKVMRQVMPKIDVTYTGKPAYYFIEVNAGEADSIKTNEQVQIESYESKIQKEHQVNPPFPGLIFDESKHRWINPGTQGIKVADENLTNRLKEVKDQLEFIHRNALRFSGFGPTQKVYFAELLANCHTLLGKVGNQMYDEVKQKRQELGVPLYTTDNPLNPIGRARTHLKEALKAIRDNQPSLVSQYLTTFVGDYDEALKKYEEGSRQRIIKEVQTLLEKSKVYLHYGEQPPKGAYIRIGPQGGRYYTDKYGTKFDIKEPTEDGLWHSTASGDLSGTKHGIHVGTYEAAKQALEATIGIRADGKDWDGTQEYGKTLLAGKKTLESRGYFPTGFNCDAPEEDYYPTGKASYSNSEQIPLTTKPTMFRVRIKGSMNNSYNNPKTDGQANSLMRAQTKQGRAKNGYYYINIGEDEGSISAVVPDKDHLEILDKQVVTIASGGFTPTMGGVDTRTKIRKKISELMEKSKQYLQPGEKPPKGISPQVSKRGKRFYETSAHYTDPNKTRLERPEPMLRTPSGERVPPAWENVWVTTNKKSPLQARGTDESGRPVYLHAKEFDKKNADKKWKRIAVFQKVFKGIDERIKKDLGKKEEALVLYTITKTGFRVGTEQEHIAKEKAYGTCTLLKSHIKVNGDRITFKFPAKKGSFVNKTITDHYLADIFRKRLEEIDSSNLFKTTSAHVRKYLHSIPNGAKFKNHDIRTYYGTESALRKIKTMPLPTSISGFKKARKIVCEFVANELGNTPAVAKKSYIATEVWDRWIKEEWVSMIKKSEDNEDIMEEFVNSIYYTCLNDIDMDNDHSDEEDDEYDDYDEEYNDNDLDYLNEDNLEIQQKM